MKQDKKSLYFIFYWVLYSGLISVYFIRSEFISILPDILLLFLLLKRIAFKPMQIKQCLGIWIPLCFNLFLLFGSLSSVLNYVSFPAYLWVLHYYVRYWFLFFCMYSIFDVGDAQRIKSIFYKAAYINICLCILQVMMGVRGDTLGGTFAGGNAEIALLIIIMTIIGSCDYFYGRLSIKKALFLLFGFFFIAILGEIKFLYFIIPLCIYISYVLIRRFSMKQIIVLVIIIFVFVPVMKGVLSLYYDDNYVEFVFNKEQMRDNLRVAHTGGERGMNRGTAIEIVTTYILRDDWNLLLGKGIGGGSSSSLFASDVYFKYKDTNYFNFTLAYVLVETGWIGLILFCAVYVFLLLRFWGIYLKSKDSQIKYWAVCGIVGSVMTGALIWYNALVIFAYFVFFFFFALCFLSIRDRKYILQHSAIENIN